MRRFNKRISKPKVADLLAAAEAELATQDTGAERLSEEDVKKFMRLSRDEINILNEIARGRPPRNAVAILAAIRLKLEHTVTPPQAKAGVTPISVTVNTLGPETKATAELAPLPPPEPQDLEEDNEEIH